MSTLDHEGEGIVRHHRDRIWCRVNSATTELHDFSKVDHALKNFGK
jgi:hypothetical protein